MTRQTLRHSLRAATDLLHRETDRIAAEFDLRTAAGLGRFLRWHAAVVLSAEAALDAVPATEILSTWPEMRRAPLLKADLASMGGDLPLRQPMSWINDKAGVLGTIYVLEGSRLGNMSLLREAAAQGGDAFVRKSSYMRAQGTPGAWPRFCAHLSEQRLTEGETRRCIDAARNVFLRYIECAPAVLRAGGA